MTEKEEAAYLRGQRSAWSRVLATARAEMGAQDGVPSWDEERRDVVAQLRDLCEDYGDNDWPDDLHLGDVIEKHLARHLRGGEEDETPSGAYSTKVYPAFCAICRRTMPDGKSVCLHEYTMNAPKGEE